MNLDAVGEDIVNDGCYGEVFNGAVVVEVKIIGEMAVGDRVANSIRSCRSPATGLLL